MRGGKRENAGRKPGSSNRTTTVIRDNFQMLVESNLNQLQQDLKTLDPKDRIKAIIDLAKFIIPTMKQAEFKTINDTNFNPIIINMDAN